jgi:uncharacterized protein YecT (DUF1311 family)
LQIKALLIVGIAFVVGFGARAQSPRSADLLPRGQIGTAAQQGYAEAVNACDGLGAFEDPAFTSCMQKGAAKADAEVNDAFRDALRMIVPYRRAELTTSQDAWLRFYRANCDMEKPLSMTAYYDCIIKMAIERKIELKNRIGD